MSARRIVSSAFVFASLFVCPAALADSEPEALPPLPPPSSEPVSTAPPATQSVEPVELPPPDDVPAAPPRKERRTLALGPVVGFGSPVGLAGGELVVSPSREIGLVLGTGLGIRGPQATAGARLRLPIADRTAIGFGFAWSMGPTRLPGRSWFGALFAQMGHSQEPDPIEWSLAQMLHGDVAFEHETRSYVLRPFLGLGAVVNAAAGKSGSCMSHCVKDGASVFPYMGVAFDFGVL